jgi:hypothetical protein
MKLLILRPDSTGRDTFLREPSDCNYVAKLLASVAQDFTIPSTAKSVIFSGDGSNFWVDLEKTAVIPTASIINGTGPSGLNPVGFYIENFVTISIIAAQDCDILMSFYK